jgi:O-methyltransferase involved in polyketide biosynthesis
VFSGVCSRKWRVDNGLVRWFDLDLPDAIALRQAFDTDTDTDRRAMLAGSATDPAWIGEVLHAAGPCLLIAEAVLPFLSAEQVRQVFGMLASRLPGAVLVTDTVGTAMASVQDSRDVLGTMSARMRWICDDPTLPERWRSGVRLMESVDFAHLPGWLLDRLDPQPRAAMLARAEHNPGMLESSRINRYQLG